MDLEDQLMIQTLAMKSAVIVCGDYSSAFPAYAKGDTRRRPVSWVKGPVLTRLVATGMLELGEGGRYHLASSAQRRFSNPNPDKAHADQHRDVSDRDIYIPEGSIRRASHNQKLAPLRRLAKIRTKDGEDFLSAAEIEAGEHFADDFACGARGDIATQNYEAAGTSGRKTSDAQEAAMSYRLDARRRSSDALRYVGPGLDRALVAILGQEWSLEQLEVAEKWVRHSGKTVLKLALGRLVEFYGTVPGEN